jgi:hypothetical protein
MPPPYPDQRRGAQRQLLELFAGRESVRIIHYSCEHFDDRPTGASPRITSIAIRRLDSGQTRSFSIHQIAEIRGVEIANIAAHYNDLEMRMLEEFYTYVASLAEANVRYVHWNMRDANYGFAAIEHRLRVLGGVPGLIPESSRYDLSRMLLDIYGTNYIEHPRLEQLANKNKITAMRFLSGADEAQAFQRGDYVALHQSTLRKVDVLADIAERARRGTLRTNSNWWTQNGGNIRGVLAWVASNAAISFGLTLFGAIMGALAVYLALRGIASSAGSVHTP